MDSNLSDMDFVNTVIKNHYNETGNLSAEEIKKEMLVYRLNMELPLIEHRINEFKKSKYYVYSKSYEKVEIKETPKKSWWKKWKSFLKV
jgi:cell division protein FtsB